MLHWVLIETGANQAYIFETNRLRYAVGASQLILESTTSWLDEVLAANPAAEVVQQLSGKALLLVEDPAVGRAVIRAISELALSRAPGLDLAGVVGPAFDETIVFGDSAGSAGFDSALRDTHRLLEQVRLARPAASLRDQIMPWHELCRESGLPAATYEKFGDEQRLVSESVSARSKARLRARERMLQILGAELGDQVPQSLEAFETSGWVGVIHADGNNVGTLFQNFAAQAVATLGSIGLDDFIATLKDVSGELQRATEAAFRAAIEVIAAREPRPSGWVLPIVIGGDDITVICHGNLAVPLVREFVLQFHAHTAGTEWLSTIAATATGRDEAAGLTASAGVAIVKPHHPFSAAYDLAEQLCESAKQIKSRAPGLLASSFDVSVSFDSTLRSLESTRHALATTDVGRASGPYVVLHEEDDLPDWVALHRVEHLDDALRVLREMSSSQAHSLRTASDLGEHAYRQTLLAVSAHVGLPANDRQVLDVVDGEDERFVRVVDAMLLDGVNVR